MGLISRASSRTYRFLESVNLTQKSFMSCEINGKLVVDRTHIKPRNYTELIEQTKELRSEINYHMKQETRRLKHEKEEEERREREKHVNISAGFTNEVSEQSRIGGGCY